MIVHKRVVNNTTSGFFAKRLKKKKKERKQETTASARAREIFHIIAGKLDSSAAAELHRFGSDEGIRTEDNVCLVCNGRGFTAVHGCN